jgi:DNA repair protein RecO (recombination protein O)
VSAPAALRTEALVLRVLDFAETSQVVHLATPEHGLVPALAKGARRPKGSFEGGLSLGVLGTAEVVFRRSAELETLRSFRETEAFRGLREDLRRFSAAEHVLGLLREFFRPALPLPALFRAATTALRLLAGSPPDAVPGWLVWFEARALAASGHRPHLGRCAACGADADREAAFSPLAGGVVHRGCAPPGDRLAVSPAGLASLRRLYAARLPELAAEPLTPADVAVARRVHDAFLPAVFERLPRSLRLVPR